MRDKQQRGLPGPAELRVFTTFLEAQLAPAATPQSICRNRGYRERSEVTCTGGPRGRRRALRRPVSERM